MDRSITKRQSAAVLITGILIALFYMSIFGNPAEGYWDTYITAPAMFMAGEKIEFLLKDGSPLYDYILQAKLPDDLVNRESYGLITKDQRIGSGITFSMAFSLFNQFGFRFLYGILRGLLFIGSWTLFRRMLESPGYAFAASFLLTVNPYMLTLDRLNPNVIVLPLLALIFYLLIRGGHSFISGLLYGVAGGIRNISIVLGPSILLLLLTGERDKKRKLRDTLFFFLGAAAGIAPVLYWNHYAMGSMFIHSSQYSGYEGFRPEFEHSILGLKFKINGLFNYPFHSEIVRTPHFAYPVFLLFPLVAIRSFGILLCSFGIYAVFKGVKNVSPVYLSMVTWAVSIYLLFAFQENWEEVKQSFMVAGFLPLCFFMISGVKEIFKTRENLVRRLAVVFFIGVVTFGSVKLTALLDFPADQRWYARFPHAGENESHLDGLPENRRNDWEFFHTRETAEEIRAEKSKLTSGNLFPARYLPCDLRLGIPLTTLDREVNTRELKTLATWEYIYGY